MNSLTANRNNLNVIGLSIFGFIIASLAFEATAQTTPVKNQQQKRALAKEEPLPEKVSFNFHVRSILSENCFFCHGPDSNQRQADLRLDTQVGYLQAIEPGKPKLSELNSRVFSEDPDLQMPPPESGRSLTIRQKRILKKWIQQGAQFEDHWAFTQPSRPPVPTNQNQHWARNPIDQFVLRKLEAKGVKPSPRARPRTIVRRLYLDLIGLPPTPTESQQFLTNYQENRNQAIDSLVKRLLESPHYGERMALPWLDAARYSDSNGFQEDGDRSQWPWRDWVVDALNDNMSFAEFTIEQLAGDLLPSPSTSQLIATGFNRNHMLNGEGGAIAEEQRNNYVFDRVDATATTWLGLTMACAQCHDHKFDPITQKDYYQFFAYFNNIDERGGVDRKTGRKQCAKPFIELPSKEQTQKLEQLDRQRNQLSEKINAQKSAITQALRDWEVEARKKTFKNMGRNIFNALLKTAQRTKCRRRKSSSRLVFAKRRKIRMAKTQELARQTQWTSTKHSGNDSRRDGHARTKTDAPHIYPRSRQL